MMPVLGVLLMVISHSLCHYIFLGCHLFWDTNHGWIVMMVMCLAMLLIMGMSLVGRSWMVIVEAIIVMRLFMCMRFMPITMVAIRGMVVVGSLLMVIIKELDHEGLVCIDLIGANLLF